MYNPNRDLQFGWYHVLILRLNILSAYPTFGSFAVNLICYGEYRVEPSIYQKSYVIVLVVHVWRFRERTVHRLNGYHIEGSALDGYPGSSPFPLQAILKQPRRMTGQSRGARLECRGTRGAIRHLLDTSHIRSYITLPTLRTWVVSPSDPQASSSGLTRVQEVNATTEQDTEIVGRG